MKIREARQSSMEKRNRKENVLLAICTNMREWRDGRRKKSLMQSEELDEAGGIFYKVQEKEVS